MWSKFDKFVLLMWKNWILQYRRPLQTAVEIIAPVLFSFLLVVIRSLVDPEENPPKIYDPFFPIDINTFLNNGTSNSTAYLRNWTLAYSPSPNTAIDRTMDIFKAVFANVVGYPDSAKLESHFIGSTSNTTFAAFQFDDTLINGTTIPNKIRVALRLVQNQRFGLEIIV